MPSERVRRYTSLLGGTLGSLYVLFGAIELIAKRDDPVSLLFWLPALWGGAALVLGGVFFVRTPLWLPIAMVLTGLAGATLATAWTVVVPLAAVALGVLVVLRSQHHPAAS